MRRRMYFLYPTDDFLDRGGHGHHGPAEGHGIPSHATGSRISHGGGNACPGIPETATTKGKSMDADPGTVGTIVCSNGHILSGRTPGEICGKKQRSGGASWFDCQGILRPYPDQVIDALPPKWEKRLPSPEIPEITPEGDKGLLRDLREYLGGVVEGRIVGSDAETQAEGLIGRITEVIDGGGRNLTAAQDPPP